MSTTTPRVTVIALCYNHAPWIEASLASVLQQSSPADRIVFCDDGSTDGSREVASRVFAGDPRVVHLRDMERNHGFIERLREALDLCGDDYVILSPCDDLMHVDAIQLHRRQIARTGTRWSLGAVQVIDDDGTLLRLCDPVAALAAVNDDVLRAAMNYHLEIHGWCFSAALYREVGGLRPDIPLEDYQLALKFTHAEKPAASAQVVAYYRRRAASMSNGLLAGKLLRHAAWLALSQVRHKPFFALRRSSELFYSSAIYSAAHRNFREASTSILLSALVWPSPPALLRNLKEGATRALRKLR